MQSTDGLWPPGERGRRAGKRAAQAKAAGAVVHVRSITIVAIRKVARMVDGAWDAMVISAGKGKFLIHRRKDQRSGHCPLLCYESELKS